MTDPRLNEDDDALVTKLWDYLEKHGLGGDLEGVGIVLEVADDLAGQQYYLDDQHYCRMLNEEGHRLAEERMAAFDTETMRRRESRP